MLPKTGALAMVLLAGDSNVTTPVLPKKLKRGLSHRRHCGRQWPGCQGTMTRNARSVFLTTAPTPRPGNR